MFRFENETYLYALLLIPILIIFYLLNMRWREKTLQRFGEHRLVNQLMPDFSRSRHRTKFTLYTLAYFFIVIGLANPQIGDKPEKVIKRGIDVIVALDVSKSMMAEDLQPTRLARAQQLVSNLVATMKNDRIGIVVFAGKAYLQMPLTVDYAAAKLFLKSISTEMVPTQGTAIGAAIDLSLESYKQQDKKHKALIIISDGENHEEGAIKLAERAKDEGVVIYTLGIGSKDGAPIPTYFDGRKTGYMRDKSGKEIKSKLNIKMLREIASITGGEYFHIRGAKNEIQEVVAELSKIEKTDFGEQVFTDYADQFQYFIGIALLLLFIELLISERKAGWFRNWSLFGE